MPVVHSVVRRADSSSESFLQHGYFIAAAIVIIALVILRLFILRWRNQRAYDFFRTGSQYPHGSQLPNNSSNGPGYHSVQLTPLPNAYRSDRRVRATDTDAFGRRLGGVEGDWGGKDALPAYDSLGRPPKYIEAGWVHGKPSHSAVIPSHEGEQGEMAHPNVASDAPGDSVYDDTHR